MSLLDKFAAVEVKAESRISPSDKDFCIVHQEAYDHLRKALSELLEFVEERIRVREAIIKRAEPDFSISAFGSVSPSKIRDELMESHEDFISKLVYHFSSKYNVTLDSNDIKAILLPKKPSYSYYFRNEEEHKAYVPGRLRDLGITHMTDEMKEWLNNEDVIDNWIFQFEYMVSYCKYVDVADLLNDYDNIVLEGAQGLLLDNDYELFAPNLTSSKTGSHYPIELLEGIEGDVEVCYVTRSYFTRHGAGRFPSECMKNSILPSEVVDKTNHTNQFQGQLRYGWFDYPLFISAVQADMDVMWKAKPDAIRSFAVTHLDETCGIIRRTEGSMNPISLPAFRHYLSYGETRETIHCQE